jgi:hypothetical protein
MQSAGEERIAYGHLFLCLVQYGTRGKCPPFSCKDSFLALFKCRLMLVSFFNTTLESVSYQSNNMRQARHCRHLNHDQSEGVVLVFAELGQSAFSGVATRNLTDRDITELMHVHQKMKTFLLRVTVTQVTLLTQTSHGGLTIQAVDLLYL